MKKTWIAALVLAAAVGLPGMGSAAELPQVDLSPAGVYSMDRGAVLDEAGRDAVIKRDMSAETPYAAYHFVPPAGWTHETYTVDGAKAEHMVNPAGSENRVLLEIHGGGYTLGLVDKYRMFTVKIGNAIQAKDVYLVDYRLAPQHVYPAALDDATAVYKYMLKRGIDANHIVVLGDSAGGNLALELALYLKANHLPQPGALLLESPWTNLRSDSRSWKENDALDLVLGKGTPLNGEVQHASYAGKLSYDDPRLSPVNADLRGLPPMLIQMGGHEVFLDDGVRLAREAAAADVQATVTIYPTMGHDFAYVAPELEESRASILEMVDFVNRVMGE